MNWEDMNEQERKDMDDCISEGMDKQNKELVYKYIFKLSEDKLISCDCTGYEDVGTCPFCQVERAMMDWKPIEPPPLYNIPEENDSDIPF